MPSGEGRTPGRGQQAGVLATVLLTLCTSEITQVRGHCLGHITIEDGASVASVANTLSVKLVVRETEEVGRQLYRVTWDEDVTPPMPDADFLRYFLIDASMEREWTVSLRESLVGLPDYPTFKKDITTVVVFPAFSDGEVCPLLLSHLLHDTNTQVPVVEATNGFLHVAEDFPIAIPLQGLEVTVTDNDAMMPNNLLRVSVQGGCPVAAAAGMYGGAAGRIDTVPLHLTSPLYHEVNHTFTCTLTVTDLGSPPLSSHTTLRLYVDAPDKPPALAFPFYTAEVPPGMEVGMPLTTSPAPIRVKSGSDVAPPPSVTYTIRDAWSEVAGTEYFAINSVTGQVALVKEVSQLRLGGRRFPFVIRAQDSRGRVSTTILEVELRSAVITTSHMHSYTAPPVLPQSPTSPAQPLPSTPSSCPDTSASLGSARLSFSRARYAVVVGPMDTFVTRVQARLKGRRGHVHYSWAEGTTALTSFELHGAKGIISAASPAGLPLGSHLLVIRATAGCLTDTAQVIVEVTEDDRSRLDLGGTRTCTHSDLVGLHAALGVVSSILAVTLLAAAVCGSLWYRRRKKAREQTEVKHISTLGSAYPNLSFTRESQQ